MTDNTLKPSSPYHENGRLEDLIVFQAALNGLKHSGVTDTLRFEETWKRQLLAWHATEVEKAKVDATNDMWQFVQDKIRIAADVPTGTDVDLYATAINAMVEYRKALQPQKDQA